MGVFTKLSEGYTLLWLLIVLYISSENEYCPFYPQDVICNADNFWINISDSLRYTPHGVRFAVISKHETRAIILFNVIFRERCRITLYKLLCLLSSMEPDALAYGCPFFPMFLMLLRNGTGLSCATISGNCCKRSRGRSSVASSSTCGGYRYCVPHFATCEQYRNVVTFQLGAAPSHRPHGDTKDRLALSTC